MRYFLIVLTTLLLSDLTHAHHSALAYFNMAETAEIEGVVTSIHWRNPHIRFSVAVADEEGTAEWEIELSSLSMFRNRGYSDPFVQVGERIKIYGNPAHAGRPAMAGLNMLLENGSEVVLEPSEGPYYALLEDAPTRQADMDDAESLQLAMTAAEGIFRVWSTAPDDPDFPMFRGNYPLTPEATEIKAKWSADEETLEGCWAKSMPYLMITPAPIEFVRSGEGIVIRFEEDDARRIIHMGESSENVPSSALGYSVGSWQGDTLVVKTSRLNSPHFDDRGVPQSEHIQLIERFTPSEGGDQLDYEINIVDPAVFSEPLKLARTFVWNPARTISAWDCGA